MRLCKEIGQWIKENVEQPVERFFERAEEVCKDVQEWVEHEILEPIDRWREEQQERCEERPCNWACACCNKWFCWFVTVVVQFVEWVIKIVGEWLVKVICDIIVTLVRVIVMILVQITKWVVLLVICFAESLCPILILTGATALVVLLLSIAALGAPQLAAAAGQNLPISSAIVGTTFAMALFLCRMDHCRVVNAIGWALKWAIVLGAIMAIAYLAPLSAWVIAIYGGLLSALIIMLEKGECRLKSMRELP